MPRARAARPQVKRMGRYMGQRARYRARAAHTPIAERAWRTALGTSARAWASTVRQAGSAVLGATATIAAAVRLAATGALLRIEIAVLALAGRLGALKTRSGRLAGGARQRLLRAMAAAAGAFNRARLAMATAAGSIRRPRVSFRVPAGAVVGMALIVVLAGSWLVVDQSGFDYPPAEPREVAGVFTGATPSPSFDRLRMRPSPARGAGYIGADSTKEPSPLAGEGRVRGWGVVQTG